MKIRHLLPSTSSRHEVEGIRGFLLRNQTGTFLSFYSERQTRYEGWYLQKGTHFYKVIERIEIAGQPITSLINLGNTVFWEHHNGVRLGWKMVNGMNGLTIAASHKVPLEIHLDPREIYQMSEWNRSIETSQDSTGYTICCMDPSLPEPLYLHIRTKGECTLRQNWNPVLYPRDKQRHSPPDSRYIFHLATVQTDLLSLGLGWTSAEAKKASLSASKQRVQAPGLGINYSHDTLVNQLIAAKATVQQGLRWLQTENGMWAGLPWFNQVWARDELITALGYTKEQQLEVINTYLGHPLLNGELETFLGSKSSCSDGVGWLCLLVKEYGLNTLPAETRTRLLHFLKNAHFGIRTFQQAPHGLIKSGHNATWMDTIGRAGFPLEIQTMYALLLEQLYELTSEPSYLQEQVQMLGRIKQHFWKTPHLLDAVGNSQIRPNVFIAYLTQPNLLRASDWQKVFDYTLNLLTTSWGGLSSLAPSDSSFRSESSGQDNQSYHNGDSWFFINNLAAIAMHRLDNHYYGKAIITILESSTKEILWYNLAGLPGEISSAKQLDSWGCGLQGFSGGTFLALLRELEDYSTTQGNDATALFWDATAASAA